MLILHHFPDKITFFTSDDFLCKKHGEVLWQNIFAMVWIITF